MIAFLARETYDTHMAHHTEWRDETQSRQDRQNLQFRGKQTEASETLGLIEYPAFKVEYQEVQQDKIYVRL